MHTQFCTAERDTEGFVSAQRKERPMKQSRWMLVGMMVILALCLVSLPNRVDAVTVTSLDFTSGAVNFDGRYGRILDRLFAQDGTITMGSYQSMSDIVDPITRGHKTFSLFTSGLNGAPAPSGTVNGSSISVDLSSLFFGWTRGNEVRAWNIGGTATGLFNPDTSEFFLSWEQILKRGNGVNGGNSLTIANGNGGHDHFATFFLQGTAAVGPAEIAIPASLFLYATGLFGIGSWTWWNRRRLALSSS